MWGKKNNGIIEYDKNTVTCDVGTAQIPMWRWNYQMWVKIKVQPNVSYVMSVLLNVIIEPSNVRKK